MSHEQHHPPGSHTHHEYVAPTPAVDSANATGYVEKDYDPADHQYPKWDDGVLFETKEKHDAHKAKRTAAAE